MAYYLGIDGGGSKTSCLLGDERSILGTGSAGGSNVVRVGEERARESFSAAIRDACRAAGVDPRQIQRTCVGVAGAARPQIGEIVHRLLAGIVGGEIEIAGDMVIALEAAFAGEAGVVVVAGTGSIAYGVNAEKQAARAGGWGFAVSDEGSGHWIGRSSVAAALRASDEDAENRALLKKILAAWQLKTHEELVLKANGSPAPDFAALFPVTLAASAEGDEVAREVLTRAGEELARLGRIPVRHLFAAGRSAPVAMTGGVFANSALVREVFYNNLRSACPNAMVNEKVVESALGALMRARRG